MQSNSQRQVAAAAAKLGLPCHLAVYHGRLAPPTPEYKTSGNAFLNRLFGAHLHDVPWTGDRNAAIRTLVNDLEAKGHKPCFVPYGVSNALGAVAYATTIAEIETQAARLDFAPAAIVHCTGSAGTQAGLIAGATLAMPATRSTFPSTKPRSKSSPDTPAPPTAFPTKPPSKQSASPAGSRRFRSIPSIPARASPA